MRSNPRRHCFLLVLLSVVAACSAPPTESGAGTTSPAASRSQAAASVAPPSSEATAEPSASAEPSETPVATIEHAIDWTIPFSITAPADWTVGPDTIETALELKVDLRIVMMVFMQEPDTPAAVIERLTTIEELDATEPQPIEVGGATGQVLDIQVNDKAPKCTNLGAPECVAIHQDTSGTGLVWIAEIGRVMRVWVVEVDGRTVLIATDARADRFESWISRFEEVLSTLEWRDS
jgi:hypothetical protein